LRTHIAPNDLRFIVRADERLTAFLKLESVKQRFQRVRFCFHPLGLFEIARGHRDGDATAQFSN